MTGHVSAVPSSIFLPQRVRDRLVQGWRLTIGSNVLGGWYAELATPALMLPITGEFRVWSTHSPDAALTELEAALGRAEGEPTE